MPFFQKFDLFLEVLNKTIKQEYVFKYLALRSKHKQVYGSYYCFRFYGAAQSKAIPCQVPCGPSYSSQALGIQGNYNRLGPGNQGK